MQLISRAAAILRVLETHPDGCSLGDIARAAGLPRPTVQRIVDALKVERLVAVEPRQGGVRLGPAIARMAVAAHSDFLAVARPHIEYLSFFLQETVAMTVLEAGKAVIVAQVASNRTVQVIAKVGAAWPLRTTADGKALLAGLPQEMVRAYFEADAAHPAAAVETSLRELRGVVEAGFAEDREATTEGICAIAIPIVDHAGRRYAISVLAPPLRYKAGRERILAALMQCRSAIEAEARVERPPPP